MIEIACKYKFTIFPREPRPDASFKVVSYTADEEIILPNGDMTKVFRAKGKFIPDTPGPSVILKGEWEEYRDKTTKELRGYTFKIEDFDEVQPKETDAIIKYLQTFKGVGKITAENMYEAFGKKIFVVIENEPEKLTEIKGLSPKKVEKIRLAYLKNSKGKELFLYLYKFGVSDKAIGRIVNSFGPNALDKIKENPYKLVEVGGIGFYTADKIAQSSSENMFFSEERVKAAILQVLTESEIGGQVFSAKTKLPEFVKYSFLSPVLFDLALGGGEKLTVTGNTCLPADILYLQLLKLLNMNTVHEFKLGYRQFISILTSMYFDGLVFNTNISTKQGSRVDVYRKKTACAEYHIAKKIAKMLSTKVPKIENLMKRITNTENRLEMLLSEEQRAAVKNSLTKPVSIITGGPGTGKTAVQKILLATYETVYPKGKKIALAAPTGMAAKKMSESTGREARTIHSLLGLKAGDDYFMSAEKETVDADLLVIDEASMVDNSLMSNLLSRLDDKTQLVIVGDVDQLPSVGCGCVLKELIDSGVVPTVRLTNIFRQGPGSSITINAARIKIGETRLLYKDDFVFIGRSSSDEILDEVKKLYAEKIKEKGVENVTVLTAFRRKTKTGVDELNPVLRSIANKVNDSTPRYTNHGTEYYLGDKVMFTKNSGELINGDIGYIKKIKNDNKSLLEVDVDFSGNIVTLTDDDVDSLVLAYATTVHKSQGSEYDTVIMVVDPAHRILIKRALVYTGVTRAKKTVYIISEPEQNKCGIFTEGIMCEDTAKRHSNLSMLCKRAAEDAPVIRNEKTIKTEQLQFL